MAITNGYATLEEFRSYLRESVMVSVDDAEFESVIESASRAIDAYCGRSFSQADSPTARRFRPLTGGRCVVDDISTTTGLEVAIDRSGTGSFDQSLTIDTDFYLEPLNGVVDGLSGWPYTRIVLPTLQFPCRRRPSVEVTARWGWAAIPDAVNLACKMLGLEHYRQRDVAFGVMGMGDFATRLRANPQVALLLDPYRTSRQAVPSV